MTDVNEHKYIIKLKNDNNMNTIVGYKNKAEHNAYIDSMNDKVKQAMSIAINHLGSSFHLTKSNGYLENKK